MKGPIHIFLVLGWTSIIRLVIVLTVSGVLLSQGSAAFAQSAISSLLLLVDVSGSMGDPIGDGNRQVKIDAARQAATDAIRIAVRKGSTEIAVLAFEGDCSNPVPRHINFTSDFVALERFISSLQPGGGTPMAEAVKYANRFMQREGETSARDQMIVLLADGQNDCGSVTAAMAELQASGVIFRHQTVGFGIEPESVAARDLQDIATAGNGTYHHAADATQLGNVLAESIDTFTVIDMLGMFGGTNVIAGGVAQPTQPTSIASENRQITDLLRQFGPTQTVEVVEGPENIEEPPTPPGAELCYRTFTNPSGLAGLRDQYEVTEFMCAASCESIRPALPDSGETRVNNPSGLSCPEQCAFAAGSSIDASFVWGRARNENHCVAAIDTLRPPVSVTHYYCDYKDNKHQLVWQSSTRSTGGFRIYLNHFPDNNQEAEFLGTTRDQRFEFEYGMNFHEDAVVDGLNLWNPFPIAGVSACNKYGICTNVVYGELVDECEP